PGRGAAAATPPRAPRRGRTRGARPALPRSPARRAPAARPRAPGVRGGAPARAPARSPGDRRGRRGARSAPPPGSPWARSDLLPRGLVGPGDLAGGTLPPHPAALEPHGAVAEAADLLQIVGDDHQRPAAGAE